MTADLENTPAPTDMAAVPRWRNVSNVRIVAAVSAVIFVAELLLVAAGRLCED